MNNNRCMIDTSVFVALYSENDQNHQAALEAAGHFTGIELLLSEAIINETYTLLRYRVDYQAARHFLHTIHESRLYKIIPVNERLREQTITILETYNDHKISYCDALSVAIMDELKIDEIFSFDHHFDIMEKTRVTVD